MPTTFRDAMVLGLSPQSGVIDPNALQKPSLTVNTSGTVPHYRLTFSAPDQSATWIWSIPPKGSMRKVLAEVMANFIFTSSDTSAGSGVFSLQTSILADGDSSNPTLSAATSFTVSHLGVANKDMLASVALPISYPSSDMYAKSARFIIVLKRTGGTLTDISLLSSNILFQFEGGSRNVVHPDMFDPGDVPLGLWGLNSSIGHSSNGEYDLTASDTIYYVDGFAQRTKCVDIPNSFNGNAYNLFLDNPLFRIDSDLTISMMVRSVTDQGCLVNCGPGPSNLYDVRIVNGEIQYSAGGIAYTSDAYIITGNWVHLAITRSATRVIKFYMDGVLVDTSPAQADPMVTPLAQILRIGDEQGGGSEFEGALQSLLIADGEMSGAAIADLASKLLGGE